MSFWANTRGLFRPGGNGVEEEIGVRGIITGWRQTNDFNLCFFFPLRDEGKFTHAMSLREHQSVVGEMAGYRLLQITRQNRCLYSYTELVRQRIFWTSLKG